MLPYFFIIIGLVLVLYAGNKIKHETQQFKEIVDVVTEAKLVQKKLIELLSETKEVSDILMVQVEKAGRIMDKMPSNLNNKLDDLTFVNDNNEKQLTNVPDNKQENIDNDDNNISNRHSQVKNLKEMGMNIEEIARELSMGKGEVQLILNLIDKEVTS